MNTIFITGTGTDIGKTYVTHSLLEYDRHQKSRLTALKPLISGLTQENVNQSDTALLLSGMGLEVIEENMQKISPWRYQTPVAPDLAQRIEKKSFHFSSLIDFCEAQIKWAKQNDQQMLIEGVGGLMSPISSNKTVLDWINDLSLPVLLVAGTYLGSISHTLTCLSVLNANKIPVLGVVLNESINSTVNIFETRRSLMQFTKVPIFIYYYQQNLNKTVANLYAHLF